MDKKPEKLVPEVRFKGFTDDWEQHKLGKVSKIVRGASPRPIKDPKWFEKDSHVGWIRISDVTEQNGRIRHLTQHLSKAGETKTRVLEQPHLLLSIAASVGFPAINYVPIGVHDGFLIFLNSKFNIDYMFYWLEKFRPLWRKYGQPGSQINLNSDIVSNTRLALPKEAEQSKVSNFLNKVELLITLQQRKLEQLKQLKKAMLQQLFIDKKSKQPNLRFKIFNGDWEQRKFLDEIDSIIDYRGKTPKKLGMSWSKTGYLALSALNVKNGWIDKKSKDSHFGSQALYDIWMKNTPLYKDQVVFTTEAPMGNVAQIPDNEKYILSQRTIAFNPSQRLIDGFLADLLSTKNIQNKLMSLATGGTAKGVSQKSLKFLKIAFPSNEEQNFIHKVIKLFQILITLQQNKLTQLTTLKKYLLQNLFI